VKKKRMNLPGLKRKKRFEDDEGREQGMGGGGRGTSRISSNLGEKRDRVKREVLKEKQ